MASPSPSPLHATPSSSTPSLLSPLSSAHTAPSPVSSILSRSTPSSPPPHSQDAPATSPLHADSTSPNPTPSQDVDPQIMEALKSKDRIYVLKLGEQMEKLIIERRPHRLELQPSTTYQRLLVHRCSAYYKLSPESDPVNKGVIFVHHSAESRIPARRICELVPAEPTAQPAFKIMRRSPSDRRSKPLSQAGSVAGEDADLSDMEQPSETGSIGGRSNATGGSNKKRVAMTIEEREAAYNEARTRIFMDFEEKEKEKDLSASSSSVVSGSASTNGGSVGDIDEAGSSPATESEWSGPVTRDKNRRGGSGPSIRRNGGPYGNSSGSSRNSRAPSPSGFKYASLYEPPASAPALYDPNQPQSNTGYHPQQYVVPYPQGPNPPYISPYYYPYHSYHPHPTSDPATPANGDPYATQQPMQYGASYAWPPHQGQPPLQSPPQIPPHPLPHQNSTPIITSPTGTQSPQYAPQQYMPSHAYTYPPPIPYYPPPGQHLPPPPPNMTSTLYDVSQGANGNVSNGFMNSRPPYTNGITSQNNGNAATNGRGSNRNGPTVANSGKGRSGTMPNQARASWSYGPGISGGYGNAGMNGTTGAGDVVGPRLSSSSRRASQNSRASSICDDVSSTASSSTTSSSSRRTYTSTTSSQHPLPARPDWAVGMKAQPSLTGRHHEGNARNAPGMTPPRSLNGNSNRQVPLQPPTSLQSMDFPPLSSMAEKRTPVVAGAWGNASTRSILQANSNSAGNVMASPTNSLRLEEPDKGFERPPPKSAQLFNPKSVFKPAGTNGIAVPAVNGKSEMEKDKERVRSDTVAYAILVDGAGSISLENSSSLENEVPS